MYPSSDEWYPDVDAMYEERFEVPDEWYDAIEEDCNGFSDPD